MDERHSKVIFLACARQKCDCGQMLAPHPAEARRGLLGALRVDACDGCGRAVANPVLSGNVKAEAGGPCVLCGTACGPGDAWASDEGGYVCSACLNALHSSINTPY